MKTSAESKIFAAVAAAGVRKEGIRAAAAPAPPASPAAAAARMNSPSGSRVFFRPLETRDFQNKLCKNYASFTNCLAVHLKKKEMPRNLKILKTDASSRKCLKNEHAKGGCLFFGQFCRSNSRPAFSRWSFLSASSSKSERHRKAATVNLETNKTSESDTIYSRQFLWRSTSPKIISFHNSFWSMIFKLDASFCCQLPDVPNRR